MIIPEYQPKLVAFIPQVTGNVDYKEWRQVLERIDELLLAGGLESAFVEHYIREYQENAKKEAGVQGYTAKAFSQNTLSKLARYGRQALRCTLARILAGESFRKFSAHLADSPVLQQFCQIHCLDVVKVPSKSTLERFEKIVPEKCIRDIVNKLSVEAADASESSAKLGLENPVEVNDIFVDTTCVKANIHFPVDWVLLCDAVRTLIQAVMLIRKHGLKNRMGEPQQFLSQVNKLAIEMTQCRRKPGAQKHRKFVLRKIKKLLKVIRGHAQRYKELLEQHYAETDLSEKQAQQIINRIAGVLEKLPKAIKQAHERIIGGRQVSSKDKILSLHEEDIHVIVRGKAGAEVEFGNTLLLGEQVDGIIVDWQFYEDQAPADSRILTGIIPRLDTLFGVERIGAMVGDRGFYSIKNEKLLDDAQIFNALCPRNPQLLAERAKDPRFSLLQKRRAQTEGRIGIVKNCFLGRPMRSKGFGNRQIRTAWSVLAHNLWVIARLPKAAEVSESLAPAA